MRRKCNLSLSVRKKRITRCFHCNSQLSDPAPHLPYCSDECRARFTLTRDENEQTNLDPVKRRSDFKLSNGWDIDLGAVEDHDDESLWLKRAVYWSKAAGTFKRTTGNNTFRKPLVLTGHGVKLRVDRRSLLVQNGFTHYPQAREEWRFFPADPDLPSRIVLLETNGYISIDVLNWLSTQEIPLVVMNSNGKVITALGGQAVDSDLRLAQLAAMENGRGFRLAIELIRRKIKSSQRTLNSLPITPAVDSAIPSLQQALHELPEVRDVEQLMLLEARAAYVYFQTWRGIPILWKGTKNHVIPPQWRTVGQRPSMFSGSNRHATHPLNALLNYAYRVLEAQLQIAIVAGGLDPSIGYLHSGRNRQTALVYDLMEPFRPEIDRSVLRFVTSTTFTPRDFVLSYQGVCRVQPQLARRVVENGLGDLVVRNAVDQVRSYLEIRSGANRK